MRCLRVIGGIGFSGWARGSEGTFAAIALLFLAALSLPGSSALAQGPAAISARRQTALRRLPLTKFYDTPDPLPPGRPGDLIRATEFGAYDLPPGVSAVRFLYDARSANAEDVASSGVILFPDGKPPAGGWPVIGWAHDVDGLARICAPSLAHNLQHGPLLSMYVKVGYAVVATDYTGLGTNFRNAFADALSNAWDVIYSIPAARRAVPQLGSRWIAMGTGEGAMAVVALAELQHDIHDANYLGSVAVSRLADLGDLYEPRSNLAGNLPSFLAYGIKTVYPQFEPSDILTDKALLLYQQVGQVCSPADASQNLSAAAALKPNWENNPFVRKYFDRNRLGMRSADAPLFVVGSADDPATKATAKIVNRLCQQGGRVQFDKYAESDPGMVVGDSVRDQMAWIQGRFANRAAPSNCPAAH